MTGTPRSADRYLHGRDSPVVVLPAWACAWLDTTANLDGLRSRVRGTNPHLDAVLTAIHLAALSLESPTENGTYGTGTEPMTWGSSAENADDCAAPDDRASSLLSTGDAAMATGVGERAIRKAIGQGRLVATKSGRRWLIDPEELQRFRPHPDA